MPQSERKPKKIGFWYRLAAVLAKPPLVLLFKRDWRGMEHIPADGGFITVVNHNSYLDPLSYAHYQYNTGRVPRFLAKVGLFKGGFVGAVMRGTGQIPVYRESTDAVGAFRAAVDAINKGECVAFYPEGTLTRDPQLWPMAGKTGAARVALLTKAPVIPVAQWGAHLAMPPYAKEKKLRLFPRKTLTVQAGPPVDLSEFHGKEPTAEVLREVTETMMDAVTAQLAEVRGEPVPAERYDHRKARLQLRQERERKLAEKGRGTAGADAADGTGGTEGTDVTGGTGADGEDDTTNGTAPARTRAEGEKQA